MFLLCYNFSFPVLEQLGCFYLHTFSSSCHKRAPCGFSVSISVDPMSFVTIHDFLLRLHWVLQLPNNLATSELLYHFPYLSLRTSRLITNSQMPLRLGTLSFQSVGIIFQNTLQSPVRHLYGAHKQVEYISLGVGTSRCDLIREGSVNPWSSLRPFITIVSSVFWRPHRDNSFQPFSKGLVLHARDKTMKSTHITLRK